MLGLDPGDEQAMLVDLAATVAADAAARWHLGRSPDEVSGPADERSVAAVTSAGLLGLRSGPSGERASWTGVCLVAEQFGRRAAAVPFLGPVLALELLHAAGIEDHDATGLTIALRRDLAGIADDPADAVAWDAAGAHSVLLRGAGGVRIHRLGVDVASTDLTRRLAAVDPSGAEVGGVLSDEAWDAFTARALTAVTADLLGVAHAALDAAVDHARVREQFGAPIGSFQAIQQLAAEAKVSVEAIRSAVWFAGWAVDVLAADEALAAARAAKAFAAGAGLEVLESVLQIFGGMSMTWETFCHVWLRRLRADRALFGDESAMHAALASRVPRRRSRAEGNPADAPDVARFRAELRHWLDEVEHPLDAPAGYAESNVGWYRALAAAGYVGVSLPAAHGGRGLPDDYEAVVNEELATAGVPAPPPVGHIAHAIADFATEQVRHRFLPGLLGCTDGWCQGFSEPGAGSDLAAVRTSARLTEDGSAFVVDGHKIWTSGALWSRWCLLLVRTEPDQPKHKGLSMIVVELDSPGVQVRPIVMATGGNEFAEVYFDGVRVDAANLVGERGQGWAIAMKMLTYERGPADMGWVARYEGELARLEAELADGRLVADETQLRRVAEARVSLQVLHWHVLRALAGRATASPAESSIGKLLATRAEQLLHRVTSDLRGARVVLDDTDGFNQYLYSRAQSIYGGTQQVQRQIVAQRLLGLPR